MPFKGNHKEVLLLMDQLLKLLFYKEELSYLNLCSVIGYLLKE